MDRFWTLFEESTIIQSLVTLIVVSSVMYMYIDHRQPPEGMMALMWAIIGFWFGSKSEYVVRRGKGK